LTPISKHSFCGKVLLSQKLLREKKQEKTYKKTNIVNRFSDEADGFRKRRAAAVLVSRDAQHRALGSDLRSSKNQTGRFKTSGANYKEVGEIPHTQRHYPQEGHGFSEG